MKFMFSTLNFRIQGCLEKQLPYKMVEKVTYVFIYHKMIYYISGIVLSPRIKIVDMKYPFSEFKVSYSHRGRQTNKIQFTRRYNMGFQIVISANKIII